jgi:hypothetical protein
MTLAICIVYYFTPCCSVWRQTFVFPSVIFICGKVAGSIPAGVSGFFIDIKSSRSHYGPGVDWASNRNEYQEHFLGLKAAGA